MQLQRAFLLVLVVFADNLVQISVARSFHNDLVETLLFLLVMPYTFLVVGLASTAVGMSHDSLDEEPVFRTVRTLVRNSEQGLEIRPARVEVVVLGDFFRIPYFQTQDRAEFLVDFDKGQLFAVGHNSWLNMAMWQCTAFEQDSALDLDSNLYQV